VASYRKWYDAYFKKHAGKGLVKLDSECVLAFQQNARTDVGLGKHTTRIPDGACSESVVNRVGIHADLVNLNSVEIKDRAVIDDRKARIGSADIGDQDRGHCSSCGNSARETSSIA